jgi:hypothetical protein
MYWLLVIVLFHADRSVPPDTQVRAYVTQKACEADLVKAGQAIQAAGYAGYEAGGIKCEPVSNPLTEKSA